MPFSLPLVPAPFLCYAFFNIYIYKGVFLMSRNKQVSETHLLGLLLAVVGGFLMPIPIFAEVVSLPTHRPEILCFWV